MRKIVIFMLLLTCLAWAEPHQNAGPKGEWISNGRWLMRVDNVWLADNQKEFFKLPWGKGIASPAGKQFTDQVDRLVFSKGGRLLLVDVTLKNPGNGQQRIGSDVPSWVVRCHDGQEIRNTGAVPQGAARYLPTSFPTLAGVAPGASTKGKMVFVLPKEREPRLFFFKASTSQEKFAGKSESLVARLVEVAASDVSPLKPSRPNAAWQSNALWKMRLIDYRVVNSMADYRKLPWNDRLTGTDLEKHLSYVERNIFGKGGSVALLTLDAKNLSNEKKPLGYELPFWQLHGTSGSPLRIAGIYQQQISWSLTGGMAKRALLNPKARTRGTMGFFLPKGFQPKKLDFQVPGSLKKDYDKAITFEI